MKTQTAKWVLLVVALLATPGYAATIDGRVVGIQDGDTITVLDATKTQHKIRLGSIDAPKLKQAFGTRSKQSLSGTVGAGAIYPGLSVDTRNTKHLIRLERPPRRPLAQTLDFLRHHPRG